jgi:DNA gyrase subunit A
MRRALLAPVDEISYLSGRGMGVVLIKLDDEDRMVGFIVARDDRDTLVLEGSQGGEQRVNTAKYKATGRGGKGHEIIKRGSLVRAVPSLPDVPPPLEP